MSLDPWLSVMSVFLMRLADVPLGTLRISLLVRGYRWFAGLVSFLESLFWLFATAQVLTGLDNPIKGIAFAGGYAVGTMAGVTLENTLALGSSILRVIAPVDSPPVAEALRDMGFDMTVINAEGRQGEMRISFGVIPKRKQPEVLQLISQINPDAFVAIEPTTTADIRAYATSTKTGRWWSRMLAVR